MTLAQAKRRVFLAALLAIPIMMIRPSHAYVRGVTSTGVPVSWRSPNITMNIYLEASPPPMTREQFGDASVLAAAAWSKDEIACTGLLVAVVQNAGAPAQAGLDRKNVVAVRADGWCQHQAAPDASGRPCYPANALAVTTIFRNTTTGEIIDSDVEINTANFTWADLVAEPGKADGNTADYQNTLTHELGHVLGLAHNCYDSIDGPTLLLDSTGNPEMDCAVGNAPAHVSDSTMYPVVPVNDIERRTLTPDDRQAVCDLYPAEKAKLAPDAGCAVAGPANASPGHSSGSAGLLALALAVMAWRRARRPP